MKPTSKYGETETCVCVCVCDENERKSDSARKIEKTSSKNGFPLILYNLQDYVYNVNIPSESKTCECEPAKIHKSAKTFSTKM